MKIVDIWHVHKDLSEDHKFCEGFVHKTCEGKLECIGRFLFSNQIGLYKNCLTNRETLMKKVLLAILLLTQIAKGYGETQVVYYPANFPFSDEVKTFITESVKHFCSRAIKKSERITLVSFMVKNEESEDGVIDSTISAILEVEYKQKDLGRDEIEIIVEDADITNPHFPRLSLKGLNSLGGVCKD